MVRVGRWVELVVAAGLVWFVFGCTPASTIDTSVRPGEPRERDNGGSSFMEAAGDSLDLLDDALAAAESELTEEQVTALAEEGLSRTEGDYVSELPAYSLKGIYARLEKITGYREVLKAEAGFRHRSRFGYRRSAGRSNGYVELLALGPLEKLVLGGIRPRLGHGLLLGARYSLCSLPRMSGLIDGLTVSPTSSVWNEQVGVAGTLGLGANKLSFAGWRETGQVDAVDDVCWVSVTRRFAAGVLGVATGARRVGPVEGGVGTNRNPDAVLFAGRDAPGVSISGEVARYQGRVFAAARTTVRADGDWNLELLNGPVPSGFSNTVIAPADLGRHQWGGAIHRIKRYRRVYTRASLYANGQRSESKLKKRRRVELTGRGNQWEISFRFAEEMTLTHSTKVVEHRSRPLWWRQSRFRVTWSNAAGEGFHQLYRVLLLSDKETGVVGCIGLGYDVGFFDARFQVNNYSLAPGQVGYVTRPGIAGYETVSMVTGTGSDLSSRICFDISGRGILSLYWGQPWGKAARWYAGLKCAL